MRANIHWIQGCRHQLAVMARPRGDDWLLDELSTWRSEGVESVVSLLTTDESSELGLQREETVCIQVGLRFHSFPIEDRSVPTNLLEFNNWVNNLLREVEGGCATAIHCRAGVGRSALVAACVLLRMGYAVAGVFDAVGEARGIPVPDTEEQREWVWQWWRNISGAGG